MQQVSPLKCPNRCSRRGRCWTSADDDVKCVCFHGYVGAFCEISDDPSNFNWAHAISMLIGFILGLIIMSTAIIVWWKFYTKKREQEHVENS
ncbi:unnamed protein product [Caenorhabditis bovis]|uniref:EGF-like domain-containing protein n=1 Tax=Caenorhabditis bovis TaxID=2654633 RepID=A0A8S1EYC0_9PELO|nr:unnamed protein product [Caenorhabditis bovis]